MEIGLEEVVDRNTRGRKKTEVVKETTRRLYILFTKRPEMPVLPSTTRYVLSYLGTG